MRKTSLLFLILFTTPTLASDYNEAFWVSGALGQAQISDNSASINKGLSIKINAGYDFSENFALYGGLGSFQNINNNSTNYLESGIKVSFPISNDWAISGNLAATSAINSEASGELQPKFGLALSYQINPKFSTQIAYDHFKDIGFQQNLSENVNQITLGLTYHFNRPKLVNNTIQQIKIYE